MPESIRIADVSSLQTGSGTVCSLNGRSLALFREAGQFYAIENVCPHRGGQLGLGTLEGKVVTCPVHGWQFNVETGECIGQPGRAIRCFPTRVEGDGIFVELPDSVEVSGDDSQAQYLVRFGLMGHVGRFEASADLNCARGRRVVLQTNRGLELGEILVAAGEDSELVSGQARSGVVLRELTTEDSSKEQQLQERQQRTFEICSRILAERHIAVDLIDSEHLFDGATFVLYYLGDAPPALADLTAELSQKLRIQVQFRPVIEPMGEPGGCHGGGGHGCANCSTDGKHP